MKYKTVIEIVCDVFDEDDAYHAAGEYLRGNYDSDIIMTCRTSSLLGHRIKMFGIVGVIVLILASVLLFKGTPLEGRERTGIENVDRMEF